MSAPSGWFAEKLNSSHDVQSFDCGDVELNDYLQRIALASQLGDGAATFVAAQGRTVLAYYSLATGSIEPAAAPQRVRAGQRADAIPVVLVARIAVATSAQGQGLGAAMLKDALVRIARAFEEVGIRAVVVHAKNEKARSFYEHFNFERSPTDDLNLLLLMKDLRKMLQIPRP